VARWTRTLESAVPSRRGNGSGRNLRMLGPLAELSVHLLHRIDPVTGSGVESSHNS